MSNVFINMDRIADFEPSGHVASIDTGESYISLALGDGVSLSFPGFDAENLAVARAVAVVLTRLADELEQKLAGRAPSLGTAEAPSAETEARPPEPLRAESQADDFDAVDEELISHVFRSRTAFEPGDDRDIWCADCEYHRDHPIHDGAGV